VENNNESNRQFAGLDKRATSCVSGGYDFGAFFAFRKASRSAFSSGLIILTLAMRGPGRRQSQAADEVSSAREFSQSRNATPTVAEFT